MTARRLREIVIEEIEGRIDRVIYDRVLEQEVEIRPRLVERLAGI